MKLTCHIVRDLLPLYVEDLCEPETAADIREHLAECEHCRRLVGSQAQDIQTGVADDASPANGFKKVKKTIAKKVAVRTLAVVATLAVLCAATAAAIILPLYQQQTETQTAIDRFGVTSNALANHAMCAYLPYDDEEKTIAAINETLKDEPHFLGIYSFPQTELFESVQKGDETHYSVASFEYNKALDKVGFLQLTAGEMFVFRTYKIDEAIPIIVSDNTGYKVGDKVTLTIDQSNAKHGKDEPQINATVCGIVKNDRRLPFCHQTMDEALGEPLNDTVYVYTPTIERDDIYAERWTKEHNTWAPYYLVFSSLDEGEYNRIKAEIGNTAYISGDTTMNYVYFYNVVTPAKNTLWDGLKQPLVQQMVLTAVLALAAELALLILILFLVKKIKTCRENEDESNAT
ncbi:MAG: zf-HC2 domain-containing protein [Clostridia bacterium]|nr:zf-HC2 domain-containing protein [Clostridia bacterium]